MVEWGDTSFEPETISYGSDLRIFRMSKGWPEKPFEDRKFQLGGKERVALLEETVYHCWVHRFNERYMGSKVNGTRRCTLKTLGECRACEHWESAPDKDGKKHGAAHCGRRQQQFGVNLLVYKSNLEGTLIGPDNQAILIGDSGLTFEDGSAGELVYEVYLWRMAADKFSDIRQIKQEWGSLKNNDISFKLDDQKDEKFQDFTPTVLPKSAWRTLGIQDQDKAKELLEYYKEKRFDVERILGKEHSHEEMLGFLGLPGGVAPNRAGASSASAEELANEIERSLAEADAAAPEQPPEPQAQTPVVAEGEVDFDQILAS